VIGSKTPASSVTVIAQMDAIDSNFRSDDDDLDTNVNGLGSPKDIRECDAQRDPTLAENVSVLTLLSHSNFKLLRSVPICIIERQHFKTCFGAHFLLYVVPFDIT
jgi:hypothetical protein